MLLHTNKRLEEKLSTHCFTGHARQQELQRFPEPKWISDLQWSDLAQDDMLPWGEQVLLKHAGLS